MATAGAEDVSRTEGGTTRRADPPAGVDLPGEVCTATNAETIAGYVSLAASGAGQAAPAPLLAKAPYRRLNLAVRPGAGGRRCWAGLSHPAGQQGIGDHRSDNQSQKKEQGNAHAHLLVGREGQAAISVPTTITPPPIHSQTTMGLIRTWKAASPSSSRPASTR